MTDRIDAARRSALMKKVPTRNTSIELIVRALLFRLGYRYRLHRKDLPGTPDIAFVGRKKAIFVNGCFWHGHRGCPKGQGPKSREEYWNAKLDANRERDSRNEQALIQMGWSVLTIWQCELRDTSCLELKVLSFLGGVRQ